MFSSNHTKPEIHAKRGNLTSYGALVLLLILSVVAWRFYDKYLQERAQRRFDEYADVIVRRISDRLAHYTMVLKGVEGFYAASDGVTLKEWRDYHEYRNIIVTYPGVQTLGFSPVIPAEELDRHLQSVRGEYFAGYQVWPEGNRETYIPVLYVEPLNDANLRTRGFDMNSEPVRRAAMELAEKNTNITISGKVTLETKSRTKHQGFQMYNPIYRKGMPILTPAERKAAIDGFVFATFRVKDLMNGVFSDYLPQIGYRIYDGTSISKEALLHDGDSAGEGESPWFQEKRTVELYGHKWTFVFTSNPAFESSVDSYTVNIILAAGLIISFLIFLIIQTQGTVTQRAISQAKQMTFALRESNERYDQLATQSRTYTWEVDARGLYTYVSSVVETVLGYSPEELVGKKHFYDLLPSEERDAFERHCMELLRDEVPCVNYEKPLLTKDGQKIWVKSNAVPLYGEKEEIVGIRGSDNDITQRKQAEEDRIARQAAETANRAKSMFLSNMSHEIRTPMNAILGFAQVLECDTSLTSKQKEQLRNITRSGRYLLALINDILDMSKIEAGMSVISPVNYNLHDLLDDLQMMFNSRAQAKGLQLIMERDEKLPAYVFGDEGKLRQVLVNLMGNAVKFTKTGGVAVRVRSETVVPPEDNPEQTLRLIVEVEDSGPGISSEDQNRIFEAFRQSEAGVQAGGTGLGLTISRHLVEMLGGELTVESEWGKGSCFRFDVRLSPGEAQLKPAEPVTRRVVGLEPGSGPYRVLVVDDVETNRNLLHGLLSPLGFEIREVVNGAEALEAVQDWAPHAVLMDMRMPVMDGYEATRRIKATVSGQNIPVIAVTASAFRDTEKEIEALGVSGYLRKPFRTEELFALLGECLKLRFLYADDSEKDLTPLEPAIVTPEQLSALPVELLREMGQAVADGDRIRLSEGIQQVETLDADAARGLKALAERYEYGRLSELFESWREKS